LVRPYQKTEIPTLRARAEGASERQICRFCKRVAQEYHAPDRLTDAFIAWTIGLWNIENCVLTGRQRFDAACLCWGAMWDIA
jgi:hypothetical protein